ncbi:MAG: LLM class flavin-dependent oxidoreductase [Rubrobacteraceae bacterium]|uniref:LLM class flavin-dependent oxidoreductase n=1 Tax=Rubrobacter naiadicus TaxID=1392641 RepID=UPI0023624162|nr:LLM class flavin-dependent oxidoreductase [Rubrobacter naiadicus]MBX6762571.1 LLM class flavin-dependent oxidoreductase [Rubrobacteraceae bacterium]MCL6438729.1 LLM class flavin-dependent oxidoreductase [Rubrobacteraceae bacterium]
MTDYGHEPLFGAFITPAADPAYHAVELAQAAERAGLDLVTFQDHPYQPAFLDTWTLISYAAARTTRIHLSGNVLNLPLRHPVLLARSAASLDLLSGGRIELGLGAGSFWDAIEAMGGPRRKPGQAVEALEEAIGIVRAVWDTSTRGGIYFEGEHYRIKGAKRGPSPAHDIGIWIGAYGPRMLRLTGRAADGWLPSLPYLKGGFSDLEEMNARIDEGAAAAGRDPSEVRRLINLAGRFTSGGGRSPLTGPPRQWAEELARLTLDYGMSGFILMADDAYSMELFGSEVAPAVREMVAAGRKGR